MVEGIDTDEVYLADERIELVSNHIINNHKCKTVNGKYTAILLHLQYLLLLNITIKSKV